MKLDQGSIRAELSVVTKTARVLPLNRAYVCAKEPGLCDINMIDGVEGRASLDMPVSCFLTFKVLCISQDRSTAVLTERIRCGTSLSRRVPPLWFSDGVNVDQTCQGISEMEERKGFSQVKV